MCFRAGCAPALPATAASGARLALRQQRRRAGRRVGGRRLRGEPRPGGPVRRAPSPLVGSRTQLEPPLTRALRRGRACGGYALLLLSIAPLRSA